MIKIRHKTTVCTAEEAMEFFSQFPDNRKLDTELWNEFKSYLHNLNAKKRVAKMRAKQKGEKK